jgi:hypothetical protein
VRNVNRDGCRDHNDAGCYQLRPTELREVILDDVFALGYLGQTWIQEKEWGYSKQTKPFSFYYELSIYKDAIQRYLDSVRGGFNPCLSYEEIQRLLEKTRQLPFLLVYLLEVHRLQALYHNAHKQ